MIRAPSSGRLTSNSTVVPRDDAGVFPGFRGLHELRRACCFLLRSVMSVFFYLTEGWAAVADVTREHTHTHMLFFLSHQCFFLLQIRLCFRGPTSCKIHFHNVVSNNNMCVCPVEKHPLFMLHWRAVWKTDPRTGPLMMHWRCVFACRLLKPLHSLELRRCWGSSRAPLIPTPLHSQHPLLDANTDLNYLLLCLS